MLGIAVFESKVFSDDFIVKGGIVQGRVQTGNAVPPLLAKAVALAIKKYL